MRYNHKLHNDIYRACENISGHSARHIALVQSELNIIHELMRQAEKAER